jgi:CRP-like cAMP-binding protein
MYPTTLRALRGVPQEYIDALMAVGEVVLIPAGEHAARQGETADAALLLLGGRAKASLQPGNRDLGELWPGEIVGAEALFGRAAELPVDVVALVDTNALRLRPDDIEALHGNAALAALQRHLMSVLARRLRTVDLDMRRIWMEEAAKAAAARRPHKEPEPDEPGLLGRLWALLGHMALVTGGNRTASLTSQGEIRLGRLPKADFDRLQLALTPEGDALRRIVLSAMLDQQRRAVGDVARRLAPQKAVESVEEFGAGPTGWSV